MLTKTQIVGTSIGLIMIIFQIVSTRQAGINFINLIKKNRQIKSNKLKSYGRKKQS